MLRQIRRIVTTNDAQGKSGVMIDGPADNIITVLTECWITGRGKVNHTDGIDHGALSTQLEPPEGGTLFRYFEIPPESEFAQSVRASIEEAKALARASVSPPAAAQASGSAAGPTPAPAAARPASISGVVKLAPELAGKVAPTDTLFVFARAAEGPRMPVAIIKAQAKDLPFQFTLDDRSSMMPSAKLSDQRSVIVGARISKSGSASVQPGDVQGYSAPVAPGTSGLQIVMSDVAP